MTEDKEQHSTSEDRCSYSLHPDEVDIDSAGMGSDLDRKGPITEEWTCQHEAHPDFDFCVFHMPLANREEKGITDSDISDQLIHIIQSDDEEVKELVGATFGDVDLTEVAIQSSDNKAVDLRYTKINGTLDFSWSSIDIPIYFEFGEIFKIEAIGATFESRVSFHGSDIGKRARFIDAEFNDKIFFSYVTFKEGASFGRATFNKRADFNVATFYRGPSSLIGAQFDNVEFQGETIFRVASFFGKARFYRTEFKSQAEFGNSIFNGRADFRESDFRKKASFDGVSFKKQQNRNIPGTTFESAQFERSASFSRVEFNRIVEFKKVRFHESLEFSEKDDPEFPAKYVVHLSEATISEGDFTRADDGRIFFDFTSAELGDLSLESSSDSDNVLRYCRFINTDFQGFDFTKYKNELSQENWLINRVDEDFRIEVENEENLVSSDFMNTFLKAKNGAKLVGDTESASAFLIKEMRCRRDRHKKTYENLNIRDLDRWVMFGQFYANKLMDVTSAFGERPRRVVITSVLVIMLSGLIYPVSFIPGFDGITEDSPQGLVYHTYGLPEMSQIRSLGDILDLFVDAVDLFVSSIYFSIATFITLGYGDMQPIGWGTQLLASIEAFIGAFLVALFVFSLGKQVSR